MKNATLSCAVLAAVLTLAASLCPGQRMQFPTAIPVNDAVAARSQSRIGPVSQYGGDDSHGYSAEESYEYGEEDSSAYGGNSSSGYGSGAQSNYGSQGSSNYGSGSSNYGSQGSTDYGSGSSNYGSDGASNYGSQGSSNYGSGATSDYGSGGASDYGTQGSSDYRRNSPGRRNRNSSTHGGSGSSSYGSQGNSNYGSGGSSTYGSSSSGYGTQGSSTYGSGSSGYGTQGSSTYGSGSSTYGSGTSDYGAQGSSTYGSGSSGHGTQGSSTYGSGSSTYGSGSSGYGTQGSSTYGGSGSSTYETQGSSNYGGSGPSDYTGQVAPGYGPGVTPGPAATLQGDIRPPPYWDPYATPGASPQALFPPDPNAGPFPGFASDTLGTMQRFLQEVRLDYVWMPGTAAQEFGINDVGLSATFAIPFLRNPQTPILVTPGFAFHYWNGPEGWTGRHLPPRVYDAYLGAAWNPQLSPLFAGELGARVGVYSDLKRVTSESLRFQGYGYGIITLPSHPNFKVKAGIVYLDRQDIKLLPAGGLIWLPSADMRLEIVFPNPEIAVKLPGYSNCEWWAYARGEYGGGSWSVQENGDVRGLDYNDLRFALGLDFKAVRGLRGRFEAGVSFERELYFTMHDKFVLNSTVFVGGNLAY